MNRALSQQGAKQTIDVNVALAAGAGFNVELEIRKPSGSFTDVSQRGLGERGAAKIANAFWRWPQRCRIGGACGPTLRLRTPIWC